MRACFAGSPMRDGSAVIVVMALAAFIAWVFQLIRRDRLYVGYGVIVVLVAAAGAATLIAPWPRRLAAILMTPLLAAPGLMALAVLFGLVMLVYTLSQLTLLSNRLSRLTQELAIRHAQPDTRPRETKPPE
jgi:hypothetical protein